MSNQTPYRVLSDVFEVATDGLVNSLVLKTSHPHVYVCAYPCDASGDPLEDLTGVTGTVVYEVETEICPYLVDIEANGDMSAPKSSSLNAPCTQVQCTITGNAVFTHYRIAAYQYA